jgi:hypothetical protein
MLALKLLIVPAVAAVLLAGLWVAAGRITDDYMASIALAVAWLLAATALLGKLTKRHRPDLRRWVRTGTVLTSVAVAGWFYWTSIRETTVHETVATGIPISMLAGEPAQGADRPQRQNVVVAAGRVESLAHDGDGVARAVKLARGGRVLTLTDFDIDPGPKVVVRLAAGDPDGDYVELGDLKGSRGDQQYRIPDHVDLDRHRTVVFWCVPFSQALARAELRPA